MLRQLLMNPPNPLLPPIAFLVMLALAWGIMWFAKGLAPLGKETGGKCLLYACGENVDAQVFQINYTKFFAVAFAYSVLHVSALMLISITSGAGAFIGAIYLGIMFFAVLSLITELKLI